MTERTKPPTSAEGPVVRAHSSGWCPICSRPWRAGRLITKPPDARWMPTDCWLGHYAAEGADRTPFVRKPRAATSRYGPYVPGPARLVTRTSQIPDDSRSRSLEHLECGHVVLKRSPTSRHYPGPPGTRNCSKCRRGLPPEEHPTLA